MRPCRREKTRRARRGRLFLRRRSPPVAARCGLEGLLYRHPFDLSGGEQQRAALAKALLQQPDILLLDEPTKGMDAGFKREFAALLRELCAQGATVLMVSHDVEFCAQHADACALVFDGGIAAQAPARDLLRGKQLSYRGGKPHVPRDCAGCGRRRRT